MSDFLGANILLCPRSKPRETYVPGEFFIANTHVTMNTIIFCNRVRVVLKLLCPVYDLVFIIGRYCKY